MKVFQVCALHPAHCYVALHQTTLLDNVTLSVFLMSSSFWRVWFKKLNLNKIINYIFLTKTSKESF
jgi:hypothetical protein